MCGHSRSPGDANRSLIVTSHNGSDWIRTYSGDVGTSAYVAAYDETDKTFYVQSLGFGSQDGVLSSTDGHSWEPAGGVSSGTGSPLLQATGTPLIRDADGAIVPNGGIYGWDGGNIWMAPGTIDSLFGGVRELGGSNSVEIIERIIEDGGERIERSSKAVPIEHVMSVATNGTIWQALGYDGDTSESAEIHIKIAKSADTGKTWEVVLSEFQNQFYYFSCIMAGAEAEG